VVLSSGFSEESATERFSGLELAGFIQKPYQLDTMIATLQRALAASEAGESLQRGSHVVLVVEDDAMNRLSTQILFEQAGFSVLTAGDGEEAIAVHEAHHEQIACVFLDANLPRKNGEETLRAIRRADSRVLAIVTSGEDPGAVRARFAGMEVLAFVQKPDPLDAAIGRLKAALTPQ
jgi:CheY-like chemotaxis protein